MELVLSSIVQVRAHPNDSIHHYAKSSNEYVVLLLQYVMIRDCPSASEEKEHTYDQELARQSEDIVHDVKNKDPISIFLH
jgi:hypothetical protein